MSFCIHASSVNDDAVYIAGADKRITRTCSENLISLSIHLSFSLACFCHVYCHATRDRESHAARECIREMQRWVERVNLWCAAIVSKLRILITEIRMFERLRIKFSLMRILFEINLRSKYCHKFITFTFFNSQVKVIPNHSVLRYFNLQLLFVFKTP